MKKKRIYLSLPYTFNPGLSFMIANKVANELMQQGFVVFSPVSHGHPIGQHLPAGLANDHDFWMDQDLPMIEWCDEVRLVVIGAAGEKLIAESRGCQEELRYAAELNKPVEMISVGCKLKEDCTKTNNQHA